MKKMMSEMMRTVARFLVLAMILAVAAPAAGVAAETAAGGKRLAVLPFAANAPKDISYLQNALRDMLATRLAATVGAQIVPRGEIDQAVPAAKAYSAEELAGLAAKLRADYLVTGTMTALGKSLSIDAKVQPAAADKAAESFFATAPTEDEIIIAIDRLAGDIASRVFGQQTSLAAVAAAPASGIPDAQSAAQNIHPDRAFLQQAGKGQQIIRSRSGGSLRLNKSQNFSLELRAMDVGDVDGDGKVEIVLAGANEVRVCRPEGDSGNLKEISRIPVPDGYRVHWVSVADLDGDKKAEIFISAADAKKPFSTAVEWDGKVFAELFRGQPWYIRAMRLPVVGWALLGQEADVDKPLKAGVHNLSIDKGKLVKGEPAGLPDGIRVFDFTFADLEGDSQPELVFITQSDRLRVMRPKGEGFMWESEDQFGGTTRYIGEERMLSTSYMDRPTGNEKDDTDRDRIYVPSRILVLDLNGDGVDDVVVNRNVNASAQVFTNYRRYPNGEIHGLSWDGIGLTSQWRTTRLDGYVADYQLIPDASGKNAMLYVGLVLKTGLVSSGKSTVLTFPVELGPAQAEAAKPAAK